MKTKHIGDVLREEREKHGIALENFAQQTRIRSEYLKALEANHFDILPAATFVKGYIKTYARELGFDHEPVLALLRRDFKESAKGTLVPREFIKPVLKKQKTLSGVTAVMFGLGALFIVLIAYVTVQWFNLQKPPELVVTAPITSQVVSGEVVVRGSTLPEAVVTINEQPVAINQDGSFQTTLFFETEGVSNVIVVASDRRGKSTRVQIPVTIQF